jgi:hypothetical protein
MQRRPPVAVLLVVLGLAAGLPVVAAGVPGGDARGGELDVAPPVTTRSGYRFFVAMTTRYSASTCIVPSVAILSRFIRSMISARQVSYRPSASSRARAEMVGP